MSFLSRFMRFLLWVLILSWGISLLRRAVSWFLSGATGSQKQRQGTAGKRQETGLARRLVRDPVCGVHVAEERAIALRDGAEILHFCSPACRDQYASSNTKKFAANG